MYELSSRWGEVQASNLSLVWERRAEAQLHLRGPRDVTPIHQPGSVGVYLRVFMTSEEITSA